MRSRELEPAPTMVITSADPYKLRELLDRESARRSIIIRSDVVEIERGIWAAEVTRLRPFERRWVKPAALGVGVLAAGVLCWWIVETVVAVLAAVSLAGVLAAVALATLLVNLPRGHSGCSTTVIVKHRH